HERPPRAADNLGFGGGRELEVQAAQRPAPIIVGQVALYEFGIQTVRLELVAAVGAGKEAPVVAQLLDVEDERTRQHRFGKDHAVRLDTIRSPSSALPLPATRAVPADAA